MNTLFLQEITQRQARTYEETVNYFSDFWKNPAEDVFSKLEVPIFWMTVSRDELYYRLIYKGPDTLLLHVWKRLLLRVMTNQQQEWNTLKLMEADLKKIPLEWEEMVKLFRSKYKDRNKEVHFICITFLWYYQLLQTLDGDISILLIYDTTKHSPLVQPPAAVNLPEPPLYEEERTEDEEEEEKEEEEQHSKRIEDALEAIEEIEYPVVTLWFKDHLYTTQSTLKRLDSMHTRTVRQCITFFNDTERLKKMTNEFAIPKRSIEVQVEFNMVYMEYAVLQTSADLFYKDMLLQQEYISRQMSLWKVEVYAPKEGNKEILPDDVEKYIDGLIQDHYDEIWKKFDYRQRMKLDSLWPIVKDSYDHPVHINGSEQMVHYERMFDALRNESKKDLISGIISVTHKDKKGNIIRNDPTPANLEFREYVPTVLRIWDMLYELRTETAMIIKYIEDASIAIKV